MQPNSHCNIAPIPQPRKANHTIIADAINAARNQIASFLPVREDDNRDLVDESGNSMRDFTDRWRSFIRCYRCLTSDE